jgi:hypothetical protein
VSSVITQQSESYLAPDQGVDNVLFTFQVYAETDKFFDLHKFNTFDLIKLFKAADGTEIELSVVGNRVTVVTEGIAEWCFGFVIGKFVPSP